jgi:hypothetical protein
MPVGQISLIALEELALRAGLQGKFSFVIPGRAKARASDAQLRIGESILTTVVMDSGFSPADCPGMTRVVFDGALSAPRESSYPAHAGYPVRRGFSVRSLTPLEYWIPAFAGMTSAHGCRAATPPSAEMPRRADTVSPGGSRRSRLG